MLSINTKKRRESCRFDVYIENFDQTSHNFSTASVVNFEQTFISKVAASN